MPIMAMTTRSSIRVKPTSFFKLSNSRLPYSSPSKMALTINRESGLSSTTMIVFLLAGIWESVIDLISSIWLVAKNMPTWVSPGSGATYCKLSSFQRERRGKAILGLTEWQKRAGNRDKYARKGLLALYPCLRIRPFSWAIGRLFLRRTQLNSSLIASWRSNTQQTQAQNGSGHSKNWQNRKSG